MSTFDPTQMKLSRELKHSSPLIACRFDPSGRFLFVSAQDNTLQRWDLWTGKKVACVGHPSWVRAIGFLALPSEQVFPRVSTTALPAIVGATTSILEQQQSATPFRMFTADYHGKLMEWSASQEKPSPNWTIEAHQGWIRAIAVSPDGKTLATCGNDHLVKLWSIADGKHLQTFAGHNCHVYNVTFHPNGKELVSADLNGTLQHWDLQLGKSVRTLEAKELSKYDTSFRATIGGIRSICFHSDGSLLACAGITNVSNAFAGVGNPLVVLLDWKTGKQKQLLKPKATFQGTGWGVAFHPQGWIIGAGGGNGGQIWFWKPEESASIHMLAIPQSIRDMALSPKENLIATACADGVARLFSNVSKPAEPTKK